MRSSPVLFSLIGGFATSLLPATSGFSPAMGRPSRTFGAATLRMSDTTGSDSEALVAAREAFSSYMVKSLEQKQKAVLEAEAKAKSEIEALRAQIEELKTPAVPVEVIVESRSGSSSVMPGTNKDMAEKIQQYQQFIGKYVVEAQEQKARAVREAETRVTALYEGKMAALTAAAETAALPSAAKAEAPAPGKAAPAFEVGAPPADAVIVDPAVVFDARNIRIGMEAAGGKSRWGDAEINSVAGGVGTIGKQPPNDPAAATPVDGSTYPPAVIAGSDKSNAFFEARTSAAPDATPIPADAVIVDPGVVYEARNAKVGMDAAAGKSRWGDAEVSRVAGGVGNIGKQIRSDPTTASSDAAAGAAAIIENYASGKSVNEARNDRIAAEAPTAPASETEKDAEKSAAAIIEKLTLEERLALGAALRAHKLSA
eukprot:CAMPEP_0194277890 /NCGR_PEP_ID=MMETSP0169-20130528/10082_1 /TAXON_ID=218684 /ORGANISM="Corethron pennatum, Strain L29A3" /LENGTH=426 /DNA_ID=CAMNT_0039021955 /DNA_START=56 /DNA_END=1336 /DNA_ORIENTATION=+